MTESEAKQKRKLNQAIKDAMTALPDSYTYDQLYDDVKRFQNLNTSKNDKKLSTQIIAGLLRWQLDNL